LVEGLLDDYSKYFTADEYKEYIKSGQGNRTGFGLKLKGVKIASIAGNSPAEKAGVIAGGEIIAFKLSTAQEFTVCENYEQLTKFLSNVNSAVTFKIAYDSEIKEFTLTKAAFTENYVYYSDASGCYRYVGEDNQMTLTKYNGEQLALNSGWAYLKFTSFNGLSDGTTGGAGQFVGALQLFKQNGNSKIIIDLRGNGGGYVSILTKIASHLCNVQTDEPFVCQKAKYNDGSISEAYSPKSCYAQYQFEKIIFLVDELTASASEALVGAALDYDKFSNSNIVRVIVEPSIVNGETCYRSFGKGIMQSLYENPLTGEAIKITTAAVYWPLSSVSIHNVGINSALDERVIDNNFGDAIALAQII
jgi:carboxyl-terminal processing protease